MAGGSTRWVVGDAGESGFRGEEGTEPLIKVIARDTAGGELGTASAWSLAVEVGGMGYKAVDGHRV